MWALLHFEVSFVGMKKPQKPCMLAMLSASLGKGVGRSGVHFTQAHGSGLSLGTEIMKLNGEVR